MKQAEMLVSYNIISENATLLGLYSYMSIPIAIIFLLFYLFIYFFGEVKWWKHSWPS